MLLVLATVLIMGGGCVDNEPEGRCPEATCGPYESRDAFFPLAVGNSWTFTDSLITDSGGSVESFTVAITGRDSGTLYSHGGPEGLWWDAEMTWPSAGARDYEWLSSGYWRQGDSVYARQPGFEGFVTALAYLVPSAADTVTWSSTYGGDVGIEISAVRLQESVTVAAGTFAPCIAYEYHAMELHRAVLCEGTGWVSFDVGGRVIRLTGYSLMP